MQDDQPTAATANDQEDNDEDALPDWRQFAKFANKSSFQDDNHAFLVPFIPKRGEKDFEPLPPSSSLPASSDLATLSQHQIAQLNESRTALFTALSTGSRHHSSRAYNSFTWDPRLARAALDGDQSFGVHLGSMGRHSSERKRLELLPEEALYLVERGAIELWSQATGTTENENESRPRVPMSVQQAWAELIGADELTIERYQVYANLRRLGFILNRTRAPKTRSSAKTTVAPTPRRTFSPRTVIQWIAWPLIRFREIVVHFGQWCFPIPLAPHLRLTVTRVLKPVQSRMTSLISGHRWTAYGQSDRISILGGLIPDPPFPYRAEQIFSRLRIIPTGHDTPLPRRALPRTPSPLTPLDPLPAPDPSNPSTCLPPLSTHPYQPFFNVYKPITKYRKTDPPSPDFQLVIINASTTSMPDLFELFDMFQQVPLSTTQDLLGPPPKVVRHNLPPKPTRPRWTFPPPKGVDSTSTKGWRTYLPWSKKGPAPPQPSEVQKMAKKGSSIYPRLKVGRRSILIAVVDNGTISMMRFSENEFGKLPWIGKGRKA